MNASSTASRSSYLASGDASPVPSEASASGSGSTQTRSTGRRGHVHAGSAAGPCDDGSVRWGRRSIARRQTLVAMR